MQERTNSFLDSSVHESPESRYEQVRIKQPKIEAPKQWYPPPEAIARPLFRFGIWKGQATESYNY